MPASPAHPLAMVSDEEITRAVEIIRATASLGAEARFAHVVLHEPVKEALAQWKPGDPVDRELRALVIPGPELQMVEVTVSVTAGEVREWREVEGMRPALSFTEAMNAMFTTLEHPDYIAALARRGITDLTKIQIDPWPAGSFGYSAETDRRIARCISFLRETPEDNGYARPIEGVIVHFDLGRNEVIEVIDHGVVSMPEQHARYYAEDHEPLRDNLKPLEITQPEGPSFTVEGNLVRWRVVVPHRVRPVRRDHAPPGRVRRPRARAHGPSPRVGQRDGGALRGPGAVAGLEERVRRGRVGARPHDPAAHARLRLPR